MLQPNLDLNIEKAPVTASQKLPDLFDPVNGETARQHDVASYITAIASELRQMAMSAGLPEITAPLEQVFYQAWHVTDRLANPGADIKPKVE